MARVFKPAAEATVYTPADGETFADIVKTKCDKEEPPITEEEVALFNWGTKEPQEVVRALVELVGCKSVDKDAPGKCVMDTARGPGGGKILLPKVWKKDGLSYEQIHTLKVKKSLPATAISITSLDKWFLPADESCEVGYALEGLHAHALKVDMDVYASNYAKSTANNDGEFVTYAYTDIPDTPILKKSISADAAERSTGSESSWKGESEAAEGILKPRDKAKRYINAASSPYCVSLRYYKKDDHKKATLRIESFWPRWSGSGGGRAVVDDSLKFKWKLKDCPGGMQGQFQVFDKNDEIVWRQALTPAECGNGEHEHNWSGGKPLIAEDKMPYRVQIQVHTPKDKDPGLGLAAMHTEVRLLTDSKIGTFGVDHEQEPQVLRFQIAPFYCGKDPVEDSAKGRKLRLAKAGYHPGPIEDGEAQAPYVMAVKEFQRDHMKSGGLLGKDQRIKCDGSITEDTKDLIKEQAPDRRTFFADNNRADITVEATLNTSVNDKDTQIIAWVDDRHNYTEVDATLAAKHLLPEMGLENYHGAMDAGDAKQTYDENSICRPWLPVEVGLPLMKKGDTLQAVNPAIPEISDSMRNATGPIRMDWTFRDLAPEYKTDATEYNANRTRPLRYLTSAIDNAKGAHNGKDAFNCTKALGGIREADYYKLPFGTDAESLMPWKALPDSGVSSVCSVTHDDLGQDAERVYAKRAGRAGVYLHPSIIGGDGYQFRAQVSFRDLPSGATHPNWKVLRDRYEASTLPQAHTAPIRVWRRDSYRAHVKWTDGATHWGAYNTRANKFYEPAMVHMTREKDKDDTFTATSMFGLLGSREFRNLISPYIQGNLGDDPKTNRYRPADEITLTNDTIWPWSTAKHLGVQGVPPSGTSTANYWRVYGNQILNDTWRSFREPLVYDLLSKVERDQGLLRGHLIGEFKASPQYWVEKYFCNRCSTDQILIETDATGGSGQNEACRMGACADGVLHSSERDDYTCNQCGFHLTNVSITRKIGGTNCTAPCTGTMRQTAQSAAGWFSKTFSSSTVSTTYTCDVCGRTRTANETTANAGSGANVACGQPCPRRGVMTADPGSKKPRFVAGPINKLSLPSWGGPLGGLFLDFEVDPRSYWAHEVGHHKHMEHGADVIQVPAQHDRATNLVDNAVTNDPDADSQKWDRTCIMGYICQDDDNTKPDAGYFCGKCLLKLRGWKVEGLADPAGNVAGP
jgi:hypothetical protein